MRKARKVRNHGPGEGKRTPASAPAPPTQVRERAHRAPPQRAQRAAPKAQGVPFARGCGQLCACWPFWLRTLTSRAAKQRPDSRWRRGGSVAYLGGGRSVVARAGADSPSRAREQSGRVLQREGRIGGRKIVRINSRPRSNKARGRRSKARAGVLAGRSTASGEGGGGQAPGRVAEGKGPSGSPLSPSAAEGTGGQTARAAPAGTADGTADGGRQARTAGTPLCMAYPR